MYSEIRELINFFARYFHLRIPKLKIGLFCEHLANNCLFRYQPYWNMNKPKQYEEQRIIRISRASCDESFTAAANAVGDLLEELLNCLPERLILYINPGELFYTISDYAPAIPIWVGSVNEDINYNEQKAPGHTPLIPPPPLPSNCLPPIASSIQPLNSLFSLQSGRVNAFSNGNYLSPKMGLTAASIAALDPGADFTSLEWRIPLSLVHPRELGYECTNQYNGFLMFRYLVPGTPNYTAETFAVTRFGSYRKRPDHEKKFVDAIKDFVNSSATTSTESSSSSNGLWSNSSEGVGGGIWGMMN